MKSKTLRLGIFGLIFGMMVSLSIPSVMLQAKNIDNVITNIFVTHEDNTQSDPWSVNETIKIHIDYAIPDNKVKEGDTSQFTLPSSMQLLKSEDFEMKDGSGNVVANVHADMDTLLVTITYTNFAQTHSNVHGSLWFYSNFNTQKVKEGEKQTLLFEEENGLSFQQEVTFKVSTENPNELLFKWGKYVAGSNGTKIQWYVRVNAKGDTIPNAVFSDYPDLTYQQIDQTSVQVYSATFKTVNGKVETYNQKDITLQVAIKTDASKIEVDFGNITGQSYLVGYQTLVVNDPVTGALLKNTAKLTGSDGTNSTFLQQIINSGGAGMGTGETGAITLYKQDSLTNAPLMGAVFDLYQVSSGIKIGTYTSDVDGEITINNLVYDDYTLIETSAPEGYDLDATPIPITINTSIMLDRTISNTKTPVQEKLMGGLHIIKQDEQSNTPLKGTMFDLYHVETAQKIGTYTSDVDGNIIINDLDYGDYTLIEVSAPEGYQLETTPINITIDSTVLQESIVLNKPIPKEPKLTGELSVIKKDAQSLVPLAGAEFALHLALTGELVGVYTTDTDGKLVIGNLPFDDYELIETKAPLGYVLDATPTQISISDTIMQEKIIVNDKLKYGQVKLQKIDDQTGQSLQGAHFKLMDEHGSTLFVDLVTDAHGIIEVTDLVNGTYWFIETKAPIGYELKNQSIEFQIAFNDETLINLTFANSKTPDIVIPNKPTKSERFVVNTWIDTSDPSLVGLYCILLALSLGFIAKRLISYAKQWLSTMG